MGYLGDLGQVLTTETMRPHQQRLKKLLVAQFLNLLHKYQAWENIDSKTLVWGDQIEAHMIQLDPPRLYLPDQMPECQTDLMPEYGRWMVETIPKKPYLTPDIICDVVQSMRKRFQSFRKLPCIVMCIPCLPIMGTNPDPKRPTQVANSKFIDDRIISKHPRFPTLTKNIRERKKKNVEIRCPIYLDKYTDVTPTLEEPFEGEVYMDAMAFGMGMCCLQTTYLTKNINHARYLYDQLSIISPLFMAISAGTPFAKGKLLATDTRWDIIASSVDDRTQQQRNPKSPSYIPKSRYSSISQYLSTVKWNLPEYDDFDLPLNKEVMDHARELAREKKIDLDERLIKHLGFLTMRDYIILYEKLVEESEDGNLVFQHLNSTNWNNVRFKPPPSPKSEIGWRVEFRTTQIQATADQNAILTVFLTYFIKVIEDDMDSILNFYIPISYNDRNFERARKIDAIYKEKFYFRINVEDKGRPVIRQLTIYQIIFGNQQFQGLLAVIQRKIKAHSTSDSQNSKLLENLSIVQSYLKSKLKGEKTTLARWMRNFITSHSDYKGDSIVSETISNDLLKKLMQIERGEVKDENFFEFRCCKSSS